MASYDYIIITDSNSELPLSIVREFAVPFVPMPYLLEGIEYPYDLGEHTDIKAFYQKVREGSVPTTVTYPPQYYVDLWEPLLAQGQDILFISFSSRLSTAFEFATAALQEVRERFPERRIELFDTRSISAGMALLVYGALKMRAAGHSLDSVLAWLRENAQRSNTYFTVGDLVYLKRGGRISASAAALGTMLNVKPILMLSREGTIVSHDKVKGRKKSIRTLADYVISRAEEAEKNACIIVHGDCEEDALRLRALIEEQVRFGEVFVQYMGPVIGTHAGPDTLGVAFLGRERP